MGSNAWRNEQEWPLTRARSTKFFLHSAGGANSVNGDGSLSTSAPGTEPKDNYQYNPQDPVPTAGGPLCCDAHQPAGAHDQQTVEKLQDVLVYSTQPFSTDTEVTGPVKVELYAASSAVDTDFTGMLVDVWPNGFAQNLTSGILRLRYRNSAANPELVKPGQIYHITLDLLATSNVFLEGHKLRLEVSSSDFPRFDRNMNTGEEQAHATRIVKATNVVYHDKARPSALIVPVVP